MNICEIEWKKGLRYRDNYGKVWEVSGMERDLVAPGSQYRPINESYTTRSLVELNFVRMDPLSAEERALYSLLPHGYRYIAKAKMDGEISAFKEEPEKGNSIWLYTGDEIDLTSFSHIINLTWEDGFLDLQTVFGKETWE